MRLAVEGEDTMGILDRMLLTVYSLVVGTVSILWALVMLGWTGPMQLLSPMISSKQGILYTNLFLLLLLAASIRLLLVSVTRNKVEANTLIADGELGQVRITVNAIENLVKRVAFQIKGIREINSRIVVGEGGVNILIKAQVACDNCIPAITSELQSKVKDYVETNAGINIRAVKVLVEDVKTSEVKTRLG